MKFDEIIRLCGVEYLNFFPRIGQIDVFLFDHKGRRECSDNVELPKTLFDDDDEFCRFVNYLITLEKEAKLPSNISMSITEDSLVMFCRTPKAKVFRRKRPHTAMSSLDYMD